MPSRRAVRMTRQAISPRLAIRTLANMAAPWRRQDSPTGAGGPAARIAQQSLAVLRRRLGNSAIRLFGSVPCWQAKTQGLSPIQPLFAKIGLENFREFSHLRVNSLRGRAGNLFARAGNSFRLFDRRREFGRNRSARLTGSLRARPWLSKCRRRGRSTRAGGGSIDPLGTGRIEF